MSEQDLITKHRVIAEFDRENADGWVSFNKSFAKANDAREEMNKAMKDPSCIRAQLLIVRVYTRT